MINTEVFLFFNDQWHTLEVKDSIPFPLTYNIADIQDITKRNNSFSKTLEFPSTKINDDVFGYIFDIASISNFNINKKVKCTIVVDTVPVLKEAYLQLTKIKTSDNIHYSYECVIFGDGDNFIKDMGTKLMSELNISELDHLYSISNVISSWTASWSNGYYYPLAETNTSSYAYNYDNIGATAAGSISDAFPYGRGVPFTDMCPAPNVKYLLHKLFSENGWSIDSQWLDGINGASGSIVIKGLSGSTGDETINNSYILTGQKPLPPATYSIFNTFQAGITNSISFTMSSGAINWGYDGPGVSTILYGVNPYGYDIAMNPCSGCVIFGETNTSYLLRQGTMSTPFKWDDDFSLQNFDYGNNFSLTTHKYKADANPNPMNFTVAIDITLPTLTTLEAAQIFQNCNVYIKVDYYRSSWPAPNTVYIPGTGGTTFAKGGEIPFLGFAGSGLVTGALGYIGPSMVNTTSPFYSRQIPSTGGRYQLVDGITLGDPNNLTYNRYAPLPNEEIWAGITFFATNRSIMGTASLGASFSFTINRSDSNGIEHSFFKNNIRNELTPGISRVGANSMLPNNMKQVDFFSSIVKMFNLYVEPDKFIPKRLRIEPRDDYYSSGVTKNWTKKVDINKDISQDLIAEGQTKQLLLTYKLDKDFYNTDYNNFSKNIYGQYRYTLDNEFSKGETKIESIFASTPVSNVTGMTLIIPKILKSINPYTKTDSFIPRFLQRAKTGSIFLTDPNQFWKLEGQTLSVYPYLGHYNHPYTPTSDLNFGQYEPPYQIPALGLLDTNNLSNNNLFQKYYKHQFDEFTNKESRIITLYMTLTSQDMNEFSFSDIIQLDGLSSGSTNYFRVNKIEYDPTLRGPFKVELLKLIYFSAPEQKQIESAQRMARYNLGLVAGGFNYSDSDTNIIGGYNNVLENNVSNTIVSGSGNRVNLSNNITISGIGNTVSNASNSYVNGNNNDVSFDGGDPITGVYVFGSGVTATGASTNIYGALEFTWG